MKKMTAFLMTGLLALPVSADSSIVIDHAHLNEITGDSEAAFKPVDIRTENIDNPELMRGATQRVIVSYSQITSADLETSFSYSADGDNSFTLNADEINQAMEDSLELTEGRIISIEYLVTPNFGIELSDTYRRYSMDGQQVGYVDESSALLGTGGVGSFTYDSEQQLHDIYLSGKIHMNVIDTPYLDFSLAAKGGAGIVHLKSDSSISYPTGSYEENNYDDLIGYSFGAGIEAKVTFLDNFFIKGGVDYRNYVMAPIEHENGSSQQFDQDGVIISLGIGFQF